METLSFGTDGWRSTIDSDFTPENVLTVARGISAYLKNRGNADKGCIVAYDTREKSKYFSDIVAGALVDCGINADVTETFCPTPQAAFAVKQLNTGGAIMITASHNPPEYNGIKFIPDYAGPATVEITSSIEQEINKILKGENAVLTGKGELRKIDVSAEYIKHLLDLVNNTDSDMSDISVVFDPMYGAGQNVFMRTLHYLGCKVIPLHCYTDPKFGGILPEPIEENLKECRKTVLENRADIGVALDGDADRFGLIDSKGIYLSPNEAMTLMLWYLVTVEGQKGSIARTVATTHMLDKIAAEYGCDIKETPVGFKYIGEVMRSGNVILGGEESGGVSLAGHIPEKDGLLAGLLLIKIAAYYKKPLSEVLREIFNEIGSCFSERLDINIPDNDKLSIIKSLKSSPPEKLGDETVSEIRSEDGVKIITDRGNWVLLRASGTEPLMRIYIEADSKESFDNIRKSALIFIQGK